VRAPRGSGRNLPAADARSLTTIVIIGGGPAGLMAAEVLSASGAAVSVYERMPTMGRKFLIAGRGGLNLTHSEPFERFLSRYGEAAPQLRPMLEAFPPSKLIAWAYGLGQETFTGSSGRIFPKAMKASPLLRAWLARLRAQNVALNTRHDWLGWNDAGALVFRLADATIKHVHADATILALGGASWPKLGSDGGWVQILQSKGVTIAPLKPANCGFTVAWSDIFKARFAGSPLKNVALTFGGRTARGDALITSYGIEGGAIYALYASLRDAISNFRHAKLAIDLRPDIPAAQLAAKLDKPRGKQSVANFLRKTAHFSPLEINLLRESNGLELPEGAALAKLVKSLPLELTATQGLARAISTAGGIAFSALDETLMLRAMPNVYAAGEMLDWEAPTGGYLLQACFATATAAAHGVLQRTKP
jgi:uncharacterized flavoprotein (TIGR03862 family)